MWESNSKFSIEKNSALLINIKLARDQDSNVISKLNYNIKRYLNASKSIKKKNRNCNDI